VFSNIFSPSASLAGNNPSGHRTFTGIICFLSARHIITVCFVAMITSKSNAECRTDRQLLTEDHIKINTIEIPSPGIAISRLNLKVVLIASNHDHRELIKTIVNSPHPAVSNSAMHRDRDQQLRAVTPQSLRVHQLPSASADWKS
jgi:hypothetical protein